MTQSGWLRGLVKEVLSGDTIVVMGAVKAGIPPEKRITLSSLVAPKLGRRDGSTKDEPFAWQSREFLRELAAGKPCVFRVDYCIEAAGNREFGTIFINNNENLALLSVAGGWSRVRSGGGQQSPFYDDLVKAQGAAEAKGLGVHSKDFSNAVRESPVPEFDGISFVASNGKGKSIQAIVEAVSSGSTLRVTMLPDLSSATVMLAGVACPSLHARKGEPENQETQPEPFSREAKYFTELRCLQREVRLVIEGIGQHGIMVASVYPPPPSTEDLSSALVKAGLAKAAEWSLNMMTSGAFRLREMERSSRQARVGLWHAYVPQTGNSLKLSDNFTGKVVEVVSGDCLVVKDLSNDVERRVTLSSIRAPRGPSKDRPAEPWAAEAKEFLRQRLIGKDVSVSMEYTRKIPALQTGHGGDERTMAFGSVTISEQSDPASAEKVNNVAELLLMRGLAQVVKHRGDEERSAHYEDLINAEEAGKKGRKGQWGTKESPVPRINDVTVPGSAGRARQHLPFLQRAGKLHGVVEYVFGGSRIKLHIPRESVTIAFSPAGVRCPGRDEPFSADAIAFTKSHCLQRDVEVEVENVDKAGTFLGTLKVVDGSDGSKARWSFGPALLEAGWGRLQQSHADVHPELVAIQEKARKVKRGIWIKEEQKEADSIQAGGANAENGNGSALKAVGESVEFVVTDVSDANTFFIQMASDGRAAWIAEQLAGMSLEATPSPRSILKVNDKCLAKFDADGRWYRAIVEKVHAKDPTAPQYDVYFIDFGNRDRVSGTGVRTVPPELAVVRPQAHAAGLAFIKAPGLDDDYGVEAAQRLSEMVGGGQRLKGVVEQRFVPAGAKEEKLLLTIFLKGDKDESATINEVLVEEGLARVAVGKVKTDNTSKNGVVEDLLDAQESARAKRQAIWQYGDPGDDSDEDNGGFPSLQGAKRVGG